MKPIFPPPAPGRTTDAPRPIQGLPKRGFDPATAGGRAPQGPKGPKGKPIRLPSMSRGR